jgi:hypothetical protein
MNPIDDFFREKLSNHELKSSERANQLFLSKLETKKKRKPLPYWYFALAASLFIVSLVGVYYYRGQIESNYTLTSTIPDKHFPKERQESIQYTKANPQNWTLRPENASTQSILQIVKSNKAQQNNVPQTVIELSHTTKTDDVQRINQEKLDAFFESENNTKMAIVEENRQNKLEETLIYLTPILALNQINSFKTIPAISDKNTELNKTITEEYFADDKSLVTRVLDEVKHLKKGEKVDFNKLGFRPIEELSLDKEGFIVSETNQIKDKINWIKARLNNN